ncbi:hypothetical protein QCA50_019953 [Cerrena zonata]|uniref:Uncharacterized protein n=1 Tax=Cerrena zonata TaxID=2478898 RepID=A0AAW0F8B8_9APHY
MSNAGPEIRICASPNTDKAVNYETFLLDASEKPFSSKPQCCSHPRNDRRKLYSIARWPRPVKDLVAMHHIKGEEVNPSIGGWSPDGPRIRIWVLVEILVHVD